MSALSIIKLYNSILTQSARSKPYNLQPLTTYNLHTKHARYFTSEIQHFLTAWKRIKDKIDIISLSVQVLHQRVWGGLSENADTADALEGSGG